MQNVLIICVGSATRSQIAEAYFNFYAKDKGLFFSAGMHQVEVNPRTIKVMSEDNIDLSEAPSKSIQAFVDIPFDHVITVCDPEDKSFLEQLNFQHWHHLPVSDPSQKEYPTEAQALEAYRITRDELKRIVLRFIGREFSPEKEQLSLF